MLTHFFVAFVFAELSKKPVGRNVLVISECIENYGSLKITGPEISSGSYNIPMSSGNLAG